MISVSVSEADERRIALHLDQLPAKLRTKLRPTIARLTDELLQRIRAAEPVRTGRLRQQTQAFVDEKEDRITGTVRVVAGTGQRSGSHEAAAALEYGAHRSFFVREHMEHLNHVFKRPSDRQLVMVEAYRRRANIQARRFMRDPAAAIRARALTELEAVVKEAAR